MDRDVARFMKYPPKAEGGATPRLAAFGDPDYSATANEGTLVVVMIAMVTGVDKMDEIFSVEGVDAASWVHLTSCWM